MLSGLYLLRPRPCPQLHVFIYQDPGYVLNHRCFFTKTQSLFTMFHSHFVSSSAKFIFKWKTGCLMTCLLDIRTYALDIFAGSKWSDNGKHRTCLEILVWKSSLYSYNVMHVIPKELLLHLLCSLIELAWKLKNVTQRKVNVEWMQFWCSKKYTCKVTTLT